MKRHIEVSIMTLLENLTAERKGWRRYVFGPWRISDEPLRRDALRILRTIKAEEQLQ